MWLQGMVNQIADLPADIPNIGSYNQIRGYVDPDYRSIVDCFHAHLNGGGGALTVYHHGEPVIDVWAGIRTDIGQCWEKDTLGLVFSVSKGVLATLVHVLVSEGLMAYDDAVSKCWPEFGGQRKEHITLRQVLCHESGLYHIRDLIEHAQMMLNWGYMTRAIEAATPIHKPGAAHGYHALTFGWIIGELIQRITGQPLSTVLEEKLLRPLAVDDFYIGLPKEQIHRKADLVRSSNQPLKTGSYSGLKRVCLKGAGRTISWVGQVMPTHWIGRPRAYHYRDTMKSLGPVGIEDLDFNSNSFSMAKLPSTNGFATARSIAKVFAMLANRGAWEGKQLIAPEIFEQAIQVQNQGQGRVIPLPLHWRLGYHRMFAFPKDVRHAFGHLGLGGCGAWCDPSRELAVGLIYNCGLGGSLVDTRLSRINRALLTVTDRM